VLRSERLRHGGSAIDSIDTALSGYTYTFPFLRMAGDGLTAFNQVSGLAGAQLVPDLATSLPKPTDGGRMYTFRLRSGIRYSNGNPVQATDFRPTFERNYALGTFNMDYDDIVGGAQCRKHANRCDLSRGIVADDAAHTVTFHLVQPDPNFLYKLALPFAYVLPAGTPHRPARTHGLPATGPYMIATYAPGRLLRLVRNPFFHEWSRAAQPAGYPDRIDLRIAGTANNAIRDVAAGRADDLWLAQPLTASQASRLELRYASQMHSDPRPNIQALFLNTRVPPFNRLDVRRAVSPAAELPRLSAVLPLHGRLDEARQVVGARPGDGEGARRTFGNSRHEGHHLGVEPGEELQPGGREGAAVARLPRGPETGSRRHILG
jgi:peptide/nickel transport system substrate-binding protein